MDHEKFVYIDMHNAEDIFKIEQIRKILSLSCQGEFSIIRWYSPERVSPGNASYVLVKQYEHNIGFVCSFASYERHQFWDFFSQSEFPINRATIVGWAYLPYDGRSSATGELKF